MSWLCVGLLVFFFKQKTAYEMRISDWSSDVCSSDLGQSAEAGLAASAVVGALDPGDDREPELVSGGPALTVEHVLLQEREERRHRRVVAGGADLAHRADHAVAGQSPLLPPQPGPAPTVAVEGANGHLPPAGTGGQHTG